MSDNIWIEQNWEHELANDNLYSIERQKDIERSYQEWQERKPAIVKLLNLIKRKYERNFNNI